VGEELLGSHRPLASPIKVCALPIFVIPRNVFPRHYIFQLVPSRNWNQVTPTTLFNEVCPPPACGFLEVECDYFNLLVFTITQIFQDVVGFIQPVKKFVWLIMTLEGWDLDLDLSSFRTIGLVPVTVITTTVKDMSLNVMTATVPVTMSCMPRWHIRIVTSRKLVSGLNHDQGTVVATLTSHVQPAVVPTFLVMVTDISWPWPVLGRGYVVVPSAISFRWVHEWRMIIMIFLQA